MTYYRANQLSSALLLIISYTVEGQAITPNHHNEKGIMENKLVSVKDSTGIIEQHFTIGSTRLNFTSSLTEFSDKVDSIMGIDTPRQVLIEGSASIDGPEKLNNRLARKRADTVKTWLTQNTVINPSIIEILHYGENWPLFRSLVNEDTLIPAQLELLSIIDSGISVCQKEQEIRSLNNGETWKYLASNIFPQMRRASITIEWLNSDVSCATVTEKESKTSKVFIDNTEFIITDTPENNKTEYNVLYTPQASEFNSTSDSISSWQRNLYVKTNAPAWLMLWTNLALEVDIAPHWSIQLPVYYSGFDYFRHDVKFRTLAFIPEARWWSKECNTGLFINIHAGIGWYNFAKGSDFRYQDHNRNTPAIGGGIGMGYRFYFCDNHRWSMEASIGVGAYRLDYDIFENRHNGLIVGRRNRTFFGIDQASLSFSYSFGIGKKGGGK